MNETILVVDDEKEIADLLELYLAADRTAELSRAMYEECSHDRAAVAKVLQGNRLSFVGFRALGNPEPGRILLKSLPFSRFCQLIRPYE